MDNRKIRIEWPPELDQASDLAWILGRPNFWCGRIAHVYVACGVDIPPKAEAEQAFVIHRMVGFLFCGDETDWRAAMETELAELIEHIDHAKGDRA